MTGAQKLVYRPRSLLVWRLNFQIHLWVGLLLTLYLVVIGLTGSLLVFRLELESLSGLRPWPQSPPVPKISLAEVVSRLQVTYAGLHVLAITTPAIDQPDYIATVQGSGQHLKIRIDPQTGTVVGRVKAQRSWISFVSDLHTTLLLGRSGRILNGVGAVLLLLVNLTGMVIWWPGIKTWKHALIVDFRRTWRRINFDLHRAAGFWALGIVSAWAVSGVYFAWPREVSSFTDSLSPIVTARPPAVSINAAASQGARPPLQAIIDRAQALAPDTTLAGVSFPYSRRAPLEIQMLRRGGMGREYTDVLYFNPANGSHLKTWHYGVNQSVGDLFLWLQVPLHFGTFWGLTVKIVWAVLGLTIPLLAITGLVLYWNRVLRRRWHWQAKLPAS